MSQLRRMAGGTEFVGSFAREIPDLELPEIAFVGRSNVGKSSALNRLVGSKKAARTSGTPGRTQMVNLFKIGDGCVFADLPGYGFAKVPKSVKEEWRRFIDYYLAKRPWLRMAVVLVDSRLSLQDSDVEMIEALGKWEIPTLVVATKVDKLTRNQRLTLMRALEEEVGEGMVVPFSAVTGDGADEVWQRIEEACR